MLKTVNLVTAIGDDDFQSFEKHADSNRAFIFGALLDLSENVEHYRSDLFHDAQWLAKHVNGECSFWFGTRDTGSDIGTDVHLIAQNNTEVHKLTVKNDNGKWTLEIVQVI